MTHEIYLFYLYIKFYYYFLFSIVTFELENFTVELRADLGAGERSLVALTFREFSLRREHLHPHESMLQVSYVNRILNH